MTKDNKNLVFFSTIGIFFSEYQKYQKAMLTKKATDWDNAYKESYKIETILTKKLQNRNNAYKKTIKSKQRLQKRYKIETMLTQKATESKINY